MNDDVRPVLAQLVQQEGAAFYGDPRRAESLLKDLVGHRQGVIFVLVTALRAGVADELLASRPGLVEVSVNRLSARLSQSFGMDPDASHWAVESWAAALGVAQPPTAPPAAASWGDETRAPGGAPPPPPPPPPTSPPPPPPPAERPT